MAQLFQVLLEFAVRHAGRGFAAHHDALGAVIADNAAPQGVVQIQSKGFFVAAEQAFDNVGHALGQVGDAVDGAAVFVGVPGGLVAECIHAMAGLQPGQIV